MTYRYTEGKELKTISHKDRRMASFRLKNETIAALHFLVSEGLAHSMTQFVEGFIDIYFNNYCEGEGVILEDAYTKGFEIMYNKTKPLDATAAITNKRVIRQMEIQRAKEQYERETNTTEDLWPETLRLFQAETLEEFLIMNDMIDPE